MFGVTKLNIHDNMRVIFTITSVNQTLKVCKYFSLIFNWSQTDLLDF